MRGLTRRRCVGLTEIDGQLEFESADSCYLYNFHNVTKYFLDDSELCNAFDLTQAEVARIHRRTIHKRSSQPR